jgi:hypothetical protein
MDRFLARTKRPADAQALIGTISKSPAPKEKRKRLLEASGVVNQGPNSAPFLHSNAAFLSGGQAYRALE